ncbi:MAG: 4-(cytidine 5'-diphospho)-2-C-methyl-D-erythritol kinase [Dictyoglomus sp.]|nr:4-(cytidine 5'-diphospho)-2-C-methyl-D-erythritol kinase [Dictyoglomus sp.]MCX7942001.1 4-(cytidine 5'-diphospho)-2-C-methyl-D-erythritol kinase [Dictyoglomaceae bacterium]MDW8188737.1 4-(cytidine 5'-diphospho)-2-C-methyl-D-erythritol kinase [Dictyoglomus sp.]
MMLKIYSYAKITLFLDVIDKRPDNYHNVKIILQNIDLSDFLLVNPLPYPYFILKSNYSSIPLEENLIYKAYKSFIEKTEIKIGLYVYHLKRIPIQGGLGGGSSNACSILFALNFLSKAGLKREELSNIAINLGSDIPFFLYGGTSLVEGKGEKVTKLPNLSNYLVLLITPPFGINTKHIYSQIDPKILGCHLDWDYVIKKVKDNKISTPYNFFENIVFKIYPLLKDIKEKLLEFTPYVSLTGTGSSIFALFENKKDLNIAKEKISSYIKGCKIRICGFTNKGFLILR